MSSVDVEVLRSLRNGEGHVLLTELAEKLRLPLSSIEKSIDDLQAAGFVFEKKPGFGCRLAASPDRLIADDLLARLDEKDSLVREIIVLEETSSTNEFGIQLGRKGHPGKVAIFAEKQTAGRGRFARRWESASHCGLWFSILLRPEILAGKWPCLTTATGVAVVKAIHQYAGETFLLKWPNDVLFKGRKVCGILIESSVDQAGNPFVVIGIGVNGNQTVEDFSPELADCAISLRQITGEKVDRSALAVKILTSLHQHYAKIRENFAEILAAATKLSAILGTWVQLQSGSELIEGVASALDENGNLIMCLKDGSQRMIAAGEVTSRIHSH